MQRAEGPGQPPSLREAETGGPRPQTVRAFGSGVGDQYALSPVGLGASVTR